MKITGACHRRRITFTASVDPAAVSICHCTDVQTLSGSPWRASVACAGADWWRRHPLHTLLQPRPNLSAERLRIKWRLCLHPAA